jgi:hypothetical protein
MWQCAIPTFEGLLPPQHDKIVMTLLYRLAEWHALAKLRMHADTTLDLLDSITTILGQEFRQFRRTVCSAYATKDLPKEHAARQRKKQRDKAQAATNNTTSDMYGGSSKGTKSSSVSQQTQMSQPKEPGKFLQVRKISGSQFVRS